MNAYNFKPRNGIIVPAQSIPPTSNGTPGILDTSEVDEMLVVFTNVAGTATAAANVQPPTYGGATYVDENGNVTNVGIPFNSIVSAQSGLNGTQATYIAFLNVMHLPQVAFTPRNGHASNTLDIEVRAYFL